MIKNINIKGAVVNGLSGKYTVNNDRILLNNYSKIFYTIWLICKFRYIKYIFNIKFPKKIFNIKRKIQGYQGKLSDKFTVLR